MQYIAKYKQSAMLCTQEQTICWQGGKMAQKKPEKKPLKNQLWQKYKVCMQFIWENKDCSKNWAFSLWKKN